MISINQLKEKVLSLEKQIRDKDEMIARQASKINVQAAMLSAHYEEPTNDERDNLYSQIDLLHHSYIEQQQIITMYQTWFARNQHWTQRFNNMMKYDPLLGNYNRSGADEPIVISEPEHWEVMKNIPKLLTVADSDKEE